MATSDTNSDSDPTTATPVGATQQIPVTKERAPSAGRPSGWRPGQVVVVAILALLLGGAGATLAWFAADRGEPEPSETAVGSTTSSTTTPDDSSTTSTSGPTSTTRPSNGGSDGDQSQGNQSQGNQSQGETVVGNSIFTATYQSNSNRSTDDFEVGDNWKIRWDVPEGAVAIEVFDAGDTLVESIEARGRGELPVADGGTYRVDITTDGSRYTVVVTDGP